MQDIMVADSFAPTSWSYLPIQVRHYTCVQKPHGKALPHHHDAVMTFVWIFWYGGQSLSESPDGCSTMCQTLYKHEVNPVLSTWIWTYFKPAAEH